MRDLVWNCRGVGSSFTLSQLKDVIRLHSAYLIFLSETKNKKEKLERMKECLKYDNLVTVELVGTFGGLAMIWKMDINIISVDMTECTVEICINEQSSNLKWWFVGVI